MLLVDSVIIDWNDALGDTISEKYEFLYIHVMNNCKKFSPEYGTVRIICNSPMSDVFECVSNFGSTKASLTVNGCLHYRGRVNSKWDLWCDFFMQYGEIDLCNDKEMAVIRVDNFVV